MANVLWETLLVLAALALASFGSDPVDTDGVSRYNGYSLFRLMPLSNMTQVDDILTLREKFEDERTRQIVFFDDIIIPLRQTIKFIVSPTVRFEVDSHLRKSGIDYTVLSEDISVMLTEHRELNEMQEVRYGSAAESGRIMAPNFFMSYDKIARLFDSWASVFPETVSVTSIGETAEKRETLALLINGEREDLPTVWIDAGIDSRVWLSTSSAVFVAFRLLHSEDAEIIRLRNKYRWFIVPVVNPDGYQYSMEKDRFWRKSRSPYYENCYGADINRNFEVNWVGAGSTVNACVDRHRGPQPFSEVETRNLAGAIRRCNETSGGLLAYFSLQYYGQYVLAPWTGRDMRKTEDYEYLLVVAKEAMSAVENATGIPSEMRKFKFGTPPDLRYPVSGSVLDWVRQTLNVRWLYAVDLAPASAKATYADDDEVHPFGFSLPATVVYAGGQQALAIVTGTLRAVEAGPTVDLLEIYAAEELEKMRRQAADGDEPREVEKTDSSERETTTDGSGAAREVEKKTDPDAGSREEL